MKFSDLFGRRLFGAALALGLLSAAQVAAPQTAAADERYAAIVMDARSNEVLLEDHADEGRFPASLTKMMTLYMLFEAIDRGDLAMSSRLPVSRRASRMPATRLGLRRGDTISVEQAIQALIVQSANDCAVVVAERLGGSEARFAARMTARARALGMTNTRFVNASGLPDARQRSSAHDMALLGQALWRDFPQYYHYFSTEGWTFRNRYGRTHNHLLGQVQGVDGIKTGYTRASGFNLVSSAERGGRRVIVVVMGGESVAARDNQVAYLIEGAYEEYARRDLDGGVQLARLPTQRLDIPFAANAFASNTGSASPIGLAAPNAAGQVLQTSNPASGALDDAADASNAADPDDGADDDSPIVDDPNNSTEEPE